MDLLFPPLESYVRDQLETLPLVIRGTFPLKRRFSAELPGNIARLSALMTKERAELNGSYMRDPVLLNAYLYYFLPWNVFRLSRLLPALLSGASIGPSYGGIDVIDFGSGPLTLPLALWIALPELRKTPLRFQCIDQSGVALDAGKKLFFAFAGEGCAWQLKTRRAAPGERLVLDPAALVTSVNVCNELFQSLPQADTGLLNSNARKFASFLVNLVDVSGHILILEPGAPRPSQVLSMIRDAFIEKGLVLEAPCPGAVLRECAMRGGRRGQKWCHFNIDTDGAPSILQKLSAKALLPKEKVTLSFLFAAKNAPVKKNKTDITGVRVISGMFPLPEHKTGRYACTEKGLALIRGTRAIIEEYKQGAFFQIKLPAKTAIDMKSGAFVLNIDETT
jgi:ribosomal protein RSM22 (predicted rRNA methylase)